MAILLLNQEELMLTISPIQSRPIPGFPGYFAWDNGKIWCMHNTRRRPCEPHELKGTINPKGYIRIVIFRGANQKVTKFLHHLVLEAFVGPCPAGMMCCHAPDPDPLNNNLSNLRWGTPQDNADDTVAMGRVANNVGSANGNAKIDEIAVVEIRQLISTGVRRKEIMRRYGLTPNMYAKIKDRRTWKHVA